MKALITGASSGIGRDIALELSNRGYDLILVSRNKKELENTALMCKTKIQIYVTDLSIVDNCKVLYNKFRDIDILINNAGYGLFGMFSEIDLDNELNMIDLNIKSIHVLTKLYLKDMINKDSGRILNVASSAAFLPGPLMNTYYSTKSYVFRLTTAIFEELRRMKSNVKVFVLCPGPVDTNFNNVAGVKFDFKSLSSKYVASYAVRKMFKNKLVIVPGFINKISKILCKIVPLNLLLRVSYSIQRKKEN